MCSMNGETGNMPRWRPPDSYDRILNAKKAPGYAGAFLMSKDAQALFLTLATPPVVDVAEPDLLGKD